jgi:YfiH family protein
MPFRQIDSLRIFQFDLLSSPELSHSIFTRHGGVSPAPWASLNVGATVGDDRERVLENRQRAMTAIGLDPESIYDAWQVHSAEVIVVDRPRDGGEILKADGLVSDARNVTLFMRFADCVPILLFDPVKMVIGLGHAGWLGTTRGFATALVQAMVDSFDCRPEDLLAGLGPSIGPDHYSIREDVINQVRSALGASTEKYLHTVGDKIHLDLWSANREQLELQGVHQIEVAEICTACHLEDWYSHRQEAGRTGRFGALMAIKDTG